tara:strand:- start:52310 stop:52486 length:177 start_codon:yes stop_codon:yes gene_type:complete
MNIDMNLALTIVAGILMAGILKHVIVIVIYKVFGCGGARKLLGESTYTNSERKSSFNN